MQKGHRDEADFGRKVFPVGPTVGFSGTTVIFNLRHDRLHPIEAPLPILKTSLFADKIDHHRPPPTPTLSNADPPQPALMLTAANLHILARPPSNAEHSPSARPINYSTVHTRDPNPPSFSSCKTPLRSHPAQTSHLLFRPPTDTSSSSSLSSPADITNHGGDKRQAGLATFGDKSMSHSPFPNEKSVQRRIAPTNDEFTDPINPTSSFGPNMLFDRPGIERNGSSGSSGLRKSTIQAFLRRFDTRFPTPAHAPSMKSDSEASFNAAPATLNRHANAVRRTTTGASDTPTSGAEGDVEEEQSDAGGGEGGAMLQNALKKIVRRPKEIRQSALSTSGVSSIVEWQKSIPSRGAESPSSGAQVTADSPNNTSVPNQSRPHYHHAESIENGVFEPKTIAAPK